MYKLSPPAVYAFEDALKDARSRARIKRMVSALGMEMSSVRRVIDADIPDMIRKNGWETARLRQGAHAKHIDPSLVFRAMRFDDAPEAKDTLDKCPPGTSVDLVRDLLGHSRQNCVYDSTNRGRVGRVCRSRYQFDIIFGCPHGCKYCPGGQVSVLFANVEEFIEKHVAPIARENPQQKIFMFNSRLSDTPCFEPEYGLTELLAAFYATTPDQYFLTHTKSANMEFLREMDNKERALMLWSLTSHSVSRLIEPGSGTTEERIAAARMCYRAGYHVRFKFKPIIPALEWRDECRRMIADALDGIRPDNIGLCTVAWMGIEALRELIDFALLDPAYVKAMEDAAESMKGVTTGPLPHEARAEIYQFFLDEIRAHDKDVPVYLCTESPAMWREFAPRLGVDAGNYACGCGPQGVPGIKRLERLWEPAEV